MKHNYFLLVVCLMLLSSMPSALAQGNALAGEGLIPIPEAVHTLVFNDCKANVIPDAASGYEGNKMNNGADIRVNGSEMTFSRYGTPVRIHLKPGTVTRIVATGSSEITLQGTFRFPGTFELSGEDASTITIKNSFDTLYADRMVVTLEDVARLNAHGRLQTQAYDFSAKDHSRMKAFIVELTDTNKIQQSQYSNTSFASFNIGHKLFPGHNVTVDPDEAEDFFDEDEDEIDLDLDGISDLDVDDVADLVRAIKLRLNRRVWHNNIDFAWGFHNWGKDRFNGLAGTNDDAAVRSSMNHILLTFNRPIVYSKHVALYAGLGLEWDKYKFHHGDIHFDLTAEPYHLANGPVANSESRLLTRYVILPIEVKFALGNHWKLGIAAIPGLHWSGSHTGLRRDVTSSNNESYIKDYSVNRYIAPYKLDARVALQYRSIGVYFQASMLSAFKNGCDELFPVKFGIIL